jgi:hypothetical protein
MVGTNDDDVGALKCGRTCHRCVYREQPTLSEFGRRIEAIKDPIY